MAETFSQTVSEILGYLEAPRCQGSSRYFPPVLAYVSESLHPSYILSAHLHCLQLRDRESALNLAVMRHSQLHVFRTVFSHRHFLPHNNKELMHFFTLGHVIQIYAVTMTNKVMAQKIQTHIILPPTYLEHLHSNSLSD